MGSETLGPGSGLFLPANSFYTFGIGDDGVEMLEFRHSSSYHYCFSGGTEACWNRAVQAVLANREARKLAEPPAPAVCAAPP